jgi:mannose-6-phosphate isomerase-like protein (cupin superfamily)
MDNFSGKVTMGECVVIPAGTMHGFQADEPLDLLLLTYQRFLSLFNDTSSLKRVV